MPNVNLKEFSVNELRKLSQEVGKEIEMRLADERKRVAAEIKRLAANAGMTVEEVLQGTGKSKEASQPKYRNPLDPEKTWSGRGKRPAWLREAIEKGKDLEDMRI